MDAADRAQENEAAELARLLELQSSTAALDAEGAKLCADCHEEIPSERLQALPSAIRCIACQAYAERVTKIREQTAA